MLTAILLVMGCALLGLGLLGILMLLWASRCAPEGHEDARGFHQTNPPPAPAGAPVSDPATAPPPATATGAIAVPRLAPMQ